MAPNEIPYGGEYIGGISLDTPHPRIVSISKNLPRVLRHGANQWEPALELDLQDGAPSLITDIICHETFRKKRTTEQDIRQCCAETEDNKRRFDLYAGHGGLSIRAFNGHTLQGVAQPTSHVETMSQRFLLHATQVASARCILREGFRLVSGRRDFHFVECRFSTRQRRYLADSSGSNGAWLVVDMREAEKYGCHFKLLQNEVVVTEGHRGRAHAMCVLSIWKDVDTMYDMDVFSAGDSRLVKKDRA